MEHDPTATDPQQPDEQSETDPRQRPDNIAQPSPPVQSGVPQAPVPDQDETAEDAEVNAEPDEAADEDDDVEEGDNE